MSTIHCTSRGFGPSPYRWREWNGNETDSFPQRTWNGMEYKWQQERYPASQGALFRLCNLIVLSFAGA